MQVGTELAWEMATERGVPRAILINRLDRENANFGTALDQVRETLSKRCGDSGRDSNTAKPPRPGASRNNCASGSPRLNVSTFSGVPGGTA